MAGGTRPGWGQQRQELCPQSSWLDSSHQSPRPEPMVAPAMPIQLGLGRWLAAQMGTHETQASDFEQHEGGQHLY